MKAKVNMPTRGKSNPPLKDLPPSRQLEEEAKRKEQQLQQLKDALAQQALKKNETGNWQSANTNMPIKNYAKNVLESKGKVSLSSTTGKPVVIKQSREKNSREKLASREKLPPLTNPTSSTTPVVNYKQNKENELIKKDFFKDTLGSTTPSNASISISQTPTQKGKAAPQQDAKAAENNLKKALSSQKETNEVEKFLNEIGLPQYTQTFLDNGFDDLETMMEVQTKHLVEMKIPAGHQIKLTKRLESLRQSNPNAQQTVPTPKSVPKNTNEINMEHIKSNSQSFYGQSKNEYIQLAEPSKDQGIGTETKNGGELLGGTFNEAESHQSFLEALNEWRSGNKGKPIEVEKKKETRPKESRSKKVRFSEPEKIESKDNEEEDDVDYISSKPKPKEESKAFFFASGGSSWNPIESGAKESATDMSPREAHQKPKLSCWNCYKLVTEGDVKSFSQKNFCSNECISAYKDFNSTKCTRNGCGKSFLKEEGIMKEGRWFCSEAHAPTKEELLMEEQRMLKRLEKESGLGNSKDEVDSASQKSAQDEGADKGDEEPIEFDLGVDLGNKKQVLTLAELEEKYKNLNQLADKAEGGEDELEDSLA